MIDELEKRIDKIIAKLQGGAFEEDKEEANNWRKEVQEAFFIEKAFDHEGIKMMVERFLNDLKEMNVVLLCADSDKLPDKARDRLIDRKKFYEEFLSLFPEAEKEIEEVERKVAENEEFLNLK